MTNSRFEPRWQYVTDITNAQNAIVSTLDDHDFVDNELVSFRVEQAYGMRQINNLRGKVLSHTNNSITINIDTMSFDPFIYPVSGENTPPVVVPVASGVDQSLFTPTVILNDAFDNVRTN